MNVIVHITARAGSKGLVGKNLREVAGISLVGHAVRIGRAFLERHRLVGDVFVDTDGEAIAEEARSWGAFVPFLRAAALSGDRVGSVDTVLGALERLGDLGKRYDTLVLLQPTSPLREVEDVAACFEAHRETGSALTVVALAHPIERALSLDPNGRLAPVFGADAVAAPRQDHGTRVTPNGAVYTISLERFREHRSFLVPNVTRAVVMPEARSVDIDHEPDLMTAERLLEQCWLASSRVRGVRAVSRGEEVRALSGSGQLLLLPPFDVRALGNAVARDPALATRLHLVATDTWADSRRLAVGLGVGLAVALDGTQPELAGAAVALGATTLIVPADRLSAVNLQIGAVLSLTAGH